MDNNHEEVPPMVAEKRKQTLKDVINKVRMLQSTVNNMKTDLMRVDHVKKENKLKLSLV